MFALPDTKALSTKGAWVHISNAMTGKPAYAKDAKGEEDKKRPIRIKVRGAHSPETQKQVARRVAQLVAERGGNMDLQSMSEEDLYEFFENAPEKRIHGAVAATMDWENMPGSDGKDVPFSPENAEKLYQFSPTTLEDVEAVIGDMTAFTKLAAKN